MDSLTPQSEFHGSFTGTGGVELSMKVLREFMVAIDSINTSIRQRFEQLRDPVDDEHYIGRFVASCELDRMVEQLAYDEQRPLREVFEEMIYNVYGPLVYSLYKDEGVRLPVALLIAQERSRSA